MLDVMFGVCFCSSNNDTKFCIHLVITNFHHDGFTTIPRRSLSDNNRSVDRQYLHSVSLPHPTSHHINFKECCISDRGLKIHLNIIFNIT